jgi:hypothetical protein
MGTVTGRPRAEGWERVMAGADGVLHAASCCSPDAWLTDRRPPWDEGRAEDGGEPEAVTEPVTGRVHVIGTTR